VKQQADSRITVHLDQPIGDVHPHVYGHFIEHLGECLYNGMWAEMLQNRKFAGHDSQYYGVVSSWKPIGAEVLRLYRNSYKGDDEGFHQDDPVVYRHDNTTYYVPGEHRRGQSQRIDVIRADGTPYGIGQDGLGVVAGKRYTGSVVLRSRGIPQARVSLGEDSHTIEGLDETWKTFTFTFAPARSYDDALFSITAVEAGTLWVGIASLMPEENEDGWRTDVNNLIRALKPPIVRYPGGNFASAYHWEDGIGDRDRRPVRVDRAWHVYEPNDVGTDEFMRFCRLMHTEPYLCVNTGDGTPEEAAAWVEYCNGPANSRYGARRARNGHAEPYNVIYWGIGNETYGNWQVGHVDPETYAHEYLVWARAMRAADPGGQRLKFLAVGATPERWPDWNATVVRIAGAEIDYLTLHHYARADEDTPQDDEYWMTVTAPARIQDLIDVSRAAIDRNAPDGKHIPISFDEWNVHHRLTTSAKTIHRNMEWTMLQHQARLTSLVGLSSPRRQNYALADGLYVASFFNMVLRNANHITMTNQAQLVNLLGLIETTDTGAYGTPEYLAFLLYVDHSGPVAVRSCVESPTFDVRAMGNMPARKGEHYLDVASTRDHAGSKVWLHVVNRHPHRAMEAAIDLGPATPTRMTIHTLTGPHPWARNSVSNSDTVRITCAASEWEASYSFPACSVTALEIDLRS